MLLSGDGHVVRPGEGRSVDLGVVSMRVLAESEAVTGGSFTLAEFSGAGAGPWTVPHVHRGFEESFYVLDGTFAGSSESSMVGAGPVGPGSVGGEQDP